MPIPHPRPRTSERHRRCNRRTAVLLFLLAAIAWPQPVEAVDFTAYWEHRARGGEELETQHSYVQRYTLGAGTGLTLQPTHAISAGANVSYSRRDHDTSDGMTSQEQITPSASLYLSNDIFRTGLTATATESRGDAVSTSRSDSWDASLASNWREPYWPRLNFTYGESTGEQQSREDAKDKTRRYGFNLDWDLQAAELFYGYTATRSSGLALDDSRSESHLLRLETGAALWHNRLNFQVSQQFQQTDTSLAIRADADDSFALPLDPGNLLGRTDPDEPPTIQEIEWRSQLPLTLETEHWGHFGVGFDFSRQVDRLIIELDEEMELVPSGINEMAWTLYTAGPGDAFWTAVGPVPAVFDQERLLLELEVEREVYAMKVVARNTTGGELEITAVRAVELITEDSDLDTRSTSHRTELGLRARLTPTLIATTRLSLDQAESTSDGTSRDTTRRRVSGNLNWSPHRYLRPSMGFSETRQEQSGTPDAISRSYSLVLASTPLPTLNVSLGARFTDNYLDNRLISTSDNYSLNTSAQLYPDLTAGLNAGFTRNVREQLDGSAAALTDSYHTRLTLNARLRPSLTADFTGSYRESETTTITSPRRETSRSSSTGSTVNLGWRPSDLLNIRLGHARDWDQHQDTYNGTLNMALVRTPVTRLNLRYAATRSDRTSQRYGLDGSWDISRNLVLRSRFNYQVAEHHLWNIQSSLSLRL
ncbi:hypothetical protein [Desulfurivibrio alkaliphilus]|uniref:TIGR03016 family PEP-CTERM system-associated outer membrane protein n=1 Tax=Desulfurivibrio alkaliphilus (strain DSM 19089 / UNIQEM U267 / AHT2) TaxID=589865 RepID=D6YZV1_DESAT|nr:hypothetical protein [Desulfurivibrio alkaliphilus]ADH85108.1 hypothetical protein DaAHT2_0402 [Desulfurivibrio alkaliphilus AHT 2]